MNRTISLIAISVAIMLFLSGIASADTLGTWTTANSLTGVFPSSMYFGSCAVNNNNIYCTLGNSANTVDTATITNNVIGTWTTTNSLLAVAEGGSCVINNNNIYCALGESGTAVETATITNNVIGTWTTANSLTSAMAFGSCAVNSNNIYCALGNNGITVDTAAITNNVIGTWTTANSLPAAMNVSSCAVNNNNIYCAFGDYGNTVETAPITITRLSNIAIAPSSPIIEGGQNIAFTGSWSNGQTPYNAVLYSGSSSSCASDITPANAVQTDNGIVFYTASFSPVSPSSNKYYCVNVVDSSSSTATNHEHSVATLVTVDTAPTGSAIVPAANTLDIGQNVIISTTLSNGAGPFTANLVYSENGMVANTVTNIPVGGTANLKFVPTYTGIFTFNVVVTDTGTTTPYVFNAPGNSVINVNNALAGVSLTVPNPKVDVGQSEAITVTWNGGTPDYTSNIIVSNPANGVIANVLTSGLTTNTPQTLTFTLGANAIGTDTINAIVTDSASTPESNTLTNSITVKSAPSITGFASSSGPFYSGHSVNFNATISGGTGPFTANLVLGGNVIASVGNIPTNTPFNFNGISLSLGSYSYNIIAIDTGLTQQIKFNSTPIVITVINAPSGGGSVVGSKSVTLTDNLSAPINSTNPVFYAFVSTPSGMVTEQEIYQAQLPSSVTFNSTQVLNFSFACSFAAGSTTYNYANYVQGLGANAVCGRNYTESGGIFEALYSSVAATSTTTITTTITTTTVNATTTMPQKITSQSGSIVLNVSSKSPAKVNFSGGGAEFNITDNSTHSISVLLMVANVTATSPAAPANYTKIIAINESVNSTSASVKSTLTYACNGSITSNRIAPYILKNGVWSAITPFTVNSETCAVTFIVPNDPIIALLEVANINATKATSTVTTSILPSTTTIAQTTTPQAGVQSNYILVAAVVVILIIIGCYFIFIRKSKN